MTPAHPRCSDAALARGDEGHGSAPPVDRWLLVEVPGAWGTDAATASSLDTGVGTALVRRMRELGGRVLLIRRPGRTAAPTSRRWAVVDSRPGAEGSVWGTYDADADLLGVDLVPEPAALTPDPVYLVCTNGRHDVCCALRGRPVAAALAALRPEQTWECSHVGGDRFAANLVLLPHGLYVGHVDPGSAAGVVLAYESGRVVPALLRGRSALPAPVQAAQHYARDALGVDEVDALPALGSWAVSAREWEVHLAGPGGRSVVVIVRAVESAEPAWLTCRATRPGHAHTWVLVSLVS